MSTQGCHPLENSILRGVIAMVSSFQKIYGFRGGGFHLGQVIDHPTVYFLLTYQFKAIFADRFIAPYHFQLMWPMLYQTWHYPHHHPLNLNRDNKKLFTTSSLGKAENKTFNLLWLGWTSHCMSYESSHQQSQFYLQFHFYKIKDVD